MFCSDFNFSSQQRSAAPFVSKTILPFQNGDGRRLKLRAFHFSKACVRKLEVAFFQSGLCASGEDTNTFFRCAYLIKTFLELLKFKSFLLEKIC
jgi:hypothetical protein